MAHAHKQIRDAVVTKLTGLSHTASNVFGSRFYPVRKSETPALLVTNGDEFISVGSVGAQTIQIRRLEIIIEAVVAGKDDIGHILDSIRMNVDNAMFLDPTLGVNVKDMEEPEHDEIEIDDNSSLPIVTQRFIYPVTYKTVEGSPGTIVN